MADNTELTLEPESDAELIIEGDALPDLLSEEEPQLPGEGELSPENELPSEALEAPSEDAELLMPENEMQMEADPAQAEPLPDAPSEIPVAAPPSSAPQEMPATTESTTAPAPEAMPPATEPVSSEAGDTTDMSFGIPPELQDALVQIIEAFRQLFRILPDWAGMALVAIAAVLLGLIIGRRMSRRGSESRPEPAEESAAPSVRPALPAPENPAFKNYQVFLETKGVSAKERDAQMRAFSDRYREMRQNLRDLIPGNKELDEQVELVRDALDAGDFDRVYALLTRIGNRENTDGLEKRAAALKHLMAAAIAKSVAGDLQMSRLEYESAAENFRQAVEALPPFQEDMHAEFLNKYGTASYQAGHHETAIAAFERALQILEKRLGKNHPDVATALNNLALLHYSRGNYDAAEPLYKRSLAIDEQTLGVDHTGVATDLNNLALLYKKKGNLEEAEPLLRRAMEIKEKNFDPGHPSLVTGLRNYASLLRSLGRDEEADIYERRATVLPPSRTGIAAE